MLINRLIRKEKKQGIMFLVIAMISSCDLNLVEEDWGDGIPSGGVQVVEKLFEHSADTGSYRLHTNDKQFSRLYGSSVWLPLSANPQNPFDVWRVTVSKSSGEENAGYGIVLCQQMVSNDVEAMLTVMIRVDRYYQIGKVIGKKYTKLTGWKYSRNLNGGYGIVNEIEVERGSGEWVLSFNGEETERFKDEEEPMLEGGIQGFLAVISPLERFPSIPVDIKFKEMPAGTL
ncbi:hypothetical protein S1OALGB6SA_1358 [Olavius algarvensis spirochete endosymbiont]|uniref:hypothetical protein n=1 Tax=Olavius algarvensis spirochete endosymbiont TaxID=260710 RepID=UPI000F0F2318|nr:hypothetical protein [Olavius algarvensis spirochete endosymbiont]CAD7837755.1 MAG: hypothetical protein [Olavius algarvensis spirochete endosymbiont]VDB00283.1 hypothetical protein S1OALGB6SA_1358 [Olavius algarvensis spirochete endosymbiont]